MSKTVDEKVVSMKFDNADFEKNVHTTMTTVGKLKESLNFDGVSKSFDNINKASKNVDISGIGAGIDAIKVKFSALDVVATTALVNMTNTAMSYGKKIMDAITIDPVSDGFNEYETQMKAVQTILANTQKEGTDVKIVNAALDELNYYADKTIYNFTEMTRNIGTFTAAGVKLDDSVSAIQGIANLAAVSGSTSQQASTAMYQLSQALAAGTVKLMDWNSVVNAGMGGQVFQDALIRTSEHLGTGAKAYIEAEGSFRESLSKGWLTTEVLTQTLDMFATAADTQEEYADAVKKFVDQGYTEEQAKEMADMARTAGNAATKVKTFTQLIDTLKEALGSGWTTTWRLIIGDFDEAKELWSAVSDVLGGFINKMSDARNAVLESALGKGLSSISEKMHEILEPTQQVSDVIENATITLNDLGAVVDRVILGEFGNGQNRFDALAEAGMNFYRVQNQVNEQLGDSWRYSEEEIAAQDELLGIRNSSIESASQEIGTTDKLSEAKKKAIVNTAKMSEEYMRSIGLTEEQIDAFRELNTTANKLGMPLEELVEHMDEINGRWLLLNSFKNIGSSLINVLKSIGQAWSETFDPITSDDIFNVIAAFHKLTESIKVDDEKADKLRRTFKGLFAIIKIVTTITGGGLRIVLRAVSAVLGAFDLSILDVTAAIGDAVVAFKDFLFNNNLVKAGVEVTANTVKMVAEAIKSFVDSIASLPKVQEFLNDIKDIDLSEIRVKAVDSFKNGLKEIPSLLTEVGGFAIDGLKNGLKDGVTSVPEVLADIGSNMLKAIKKVLGIHSPSKEMYDVGVYAIQGLTNGINATASGVWIAIKDIGSGILTFIKDFDWHSAFSIAVSTGLFLVVKDMIPVIKNITEPLAGIGSVLKGTGSILESTAGVIEASEKQITKVIGGVAKILKAFSKDIKAKAFKTRAEGIKELAVSVLILAGALKLISTIDADKDLWPSVKAIGALTVIFGVFTLAMDKLTGSVMKFSKNEKSIDLSGLKLSLVNIGVALVLLAATCKIIGSLNPDEYQQGILGVISLMGALTLMMVAFGTFVKDESAKNIDKAGKMIRKIATSLLLMGVAMKLIGTLDKNVAINGTVFIGALVIFMGAMVGITNFAGNDLDKVGSMMVKMAVAIGLMVIAVKMISNLRPVEMKKGVAFITAFLVFLDALVAITTITGEQKIASVGKMLLSVSAAMLLMVGVAKLAGSMSLTEMSKGITCIGAFSALVTALIAISKVSSTEKIARVSATMIAMSLSIGIMAGISVLLSLIELPALAKGALAVSALGLIFTQMVKATKGAANVKGSVMAMSVAIGIMAASIAVLSFIKPEKLVGPVAAMSVLMGMFAIVELAGSRIQDAYITIGIMAASIAVLTGAIVGLSFIPTDRAIKSVSSLSILLLAFSASLKVLSTMKGINLKAVGSTALLATVMTAITYALVGVLALMNVIDSEKSLKNATALSTLLLSLSSCCVILSGVGVLGTAGIKGVGVLATLIGGVSIILTALAGIDVLTNGKASTFLKTGVTMLETVGKAIGSFFGSIIGGFGSGITSGLPEMGNNLSAFMTSLQPFIEGANSISKDSVDGMTSLVKMVGILTVSNLIESFSNKLLGTSSMDMFAEQLSQFADAIIAFSGKVTGNIDENSVESAANAGRMLAEMTDKIPKKDGVLQWLLGQSDLALFSEQLQQFGDAIVNFSQTVSGKVDEGAVTSAANAGQIMAEMEGKLGKKDGVLEWFLGDKDMAKFGARLTQFGEAITGFSDVVSSKGINAEAVTAASNAGQIMAEMEGKLNNTDGVLQWFNGDKDMSEFGAQLIQFGKSITEYSGTITDKGIDSNAIIVSANAGKMLAELQNSLPASDGILQKLFTGDKSMETFGSNLVAFGKKLIDYSDVVTDVDIDAITNSSKAADGLVKVANKVYKIDTSGVSNFDGVTAIAGMLKSYADDVKDISIDNIAKSAEAGVKLADFINHLSEISTSGIDGFKTALTSITDISASDISGIFDGLVSGLQEIGSTMADTLRIGFESQESVFQDSVLNCISEAIQSISSKNSDFISVGNEIMNSFIGAISDNKGHLHGELDDGIVQAIDDSRDYYSSFYEAGRYLVEGFASGIGDSSYKATIAARTMADAVDEAVRDELDIHSPSRKLRKTGQFVPEGFIQGISDLNGKVKQSAVTMAKNVVSGAENALSYLSNLVNSDIDMTPTIRPVMDLTGVKANLSIMNGMITDASAVGLNSNINAITSLMIQNSQNGVNDDVISAINKLERSVNNLERPSYTVNGITYDDSSNISTAIQELVRAARIERRV